MAETERGQHEHYMRMALSLAMRGTGSVSPNPRVGCVIVDCSTPGGRVVSCGYHKKYGGPHAEANALGNAAEPVVGMTAYVTLEPCCHTGHTPPCCDALISAGLSRVVIGMPDPDPRVSGGGASRLFSSGVEVISGVLRDECLRINRGFVKRVTEGRPWVTVKAAVSLDGDIALADGSSKWITGAQARRAAHLMRAENDVVLVGARTVIKDDPSLTVRDTDGRSPMKAVVDKNLEIPPMSGLLDGHCLIFAGPSPDEKKLSALSGRGAKVVRMKTDEKGHIPPQDMLAELAAAGLNYVMIEGGAGIASSFLSSGAVDEIAFFASPKLMGRGIHVTDALSFDRMGDVIGVEGISAKKIGGDILVKGVLPCSPA
jgi:diaminohydroxyphosphoribosylaminopyrimidine deaminase/5-amino-6-(5-phosphoribosylamino)uracil reductase